MEVVCTLLKTVEILNLQQSGGVFSAQEHQVVWQAALPSMSTELATGKGGGVHLQKGSSRHLLPKRSAVLPAKAPPLCEQPRLNKKQCTAMFRLSSAVVVFGLGTAWEGPCLQVFYHVLVFGPT